MNADECVAAGGHHPVTTWRGHIGWFAEHWEQCATCPATRFGLLDTTRRDARMQWYPWRELVSSRP